MEPSRHDVFGQAVGTRLPWRYRVCATLAALCTLVSCVSNPARESGADIAAEAAGPPVAVVDNATVDPERASVAAEQSERVKSAIGHLQAGRVADAKSELAAVLQQDPGNKVARSLSTQIQTDPVRYFGGPESFSYTIQQGETLADVAQRFLDESLKFYILARFNGVSDPSRLVPGRTIKVPSKKTAESIQAASEDPRVQSAKRFYEAGRYQQAIDALEGSTAGNSEARDLLASSYGTYAGDLHKKKNYDAAHALFEKALAIRPENEGFRAQLRQVESQRAIETRYRAGMDAIAAGDNPKALEAFNAVLKLDPAHEGANQQIARLREDTVESMHRDALVEYNKQNLDKAIDLWDHVLALLPTHQTAKLYRARALDLRSKLQRLQTN